MLVVGLIDIQHMQSVICNQRFFFFFFPPKKLQIATILVIWKSSDRCLQQLSEGVSHNIEEKSLSSASELEFYVVFFNEFMICLLTVTNFLSIKDLCPCHNVML